MEEHSFIKPAVSLVMLIIGIMCDTFGVSFFANDALRVAWYVVAFLPVGVGVMREAWECALQKDVFSEFTLMSVASIGAFFIGEYPEAVAVMLFYCIGETLQDMAVDKARDNIKSLIAFRPDKARVVNDGVEEERKPEEVSVGEVIEVRPGERVPLDGELISGDAAFNTAALTGESMPRTIEKGREALAGMIATDTVVRLCVKRKASESAVARILNMVEEASSRKAPAELFIRRFARIYTPTVIFLAALTAIVPWLWSLIDDTFIYNGGTWVYRSLIFLVISCPCALVVSIPLSYFVGIGSASKQGILFKGGNWLDAVTHVDTVVFDKTGTLTRGEFSVVQVSGSHIDEMLRAVSAIERTSSHPIAKAVVSYAGEGDAVAEDIKNIAGYGLTAIVDGSHWAVGTLRLLNREGVAYPKELVNVAETIVACARNGQYVGSLFLADTLKDDAHQAIKELRNSGVERIEIMSGDKQALVDKVASELQADKSHGDLMPEGKVGHIEALKQEGRNVAFVGDGINDAPVLALSDVGIAMGALGSDMAVETADIVLQTDQPSKVATAIRIGRSTHSIVKQNITFAISVKLLVMLLGLLGIANLWLAVFADVGVALIAVLNAMRLMKK